MIKKTKGNIVKADAEALVNTVNCVGIMGKGIALQFKKAFPEAYFKDYQDACKRGDLQPGKIQVWETGTLLNPKYIINFPTKKHWKGSSKYEYIESGLQALVDVIKERNIRSIAIPPLGSGLGGLQWTRVREMIEKAFVALPDVELLLFEPEGAPKPEEMPVRTSTPKMTLARALFIKLMQFYTRHAYRLTLLEIQKLAYFLQESGLNLRLNYVKHLYGPYAHNLNHVLQVMEGHFIRGYGDTQRPDVEISLMPEAVKKADEYLQNHKEEQLQLERVANLVEGFETPYGMELLASVHWMAKHENAQDIVREVHGWNTRKKKLLRAEHILLAYQRLQEEGWC